MHYTQSLYPRQLITNNKTTQVWDLGGQTSIRPYWRCYYPNTDAIIFVVDSADQARLAVARQELTAMLQEEEVRCFERGAETRRCLHEQLPQFRLASPVAASALLTPQSISWLLTFAFARPLVTFLGQPSWRGPSSSSLPTSRTRRGP